MSGLRWKCRDRWIDLAARAHVMGVVNVTPDSFSDGGRYDTTEAAVRHALTLDEQGADFIDIGGESSRPGAQAVSADDELRRVMPVLERLAGQTRALLSIDTSKAAVARAAVQAGAAVINDISAGRFDPLLLRVAADTGAGLVLMHMQGEPRTMQVAPQYEDVVREVRAELELRTADARRCGVAAEQVVWDPGICFGKTVEHNVALLRRLPELVSGGRPLLVGLSRKSFLGALTGLPVEERLAPSLAGLLLAVQRGARVVRVHDVKESCAALRVLARLSGETAACAS